MNQEPFLSRWARLKRRGDGELSPPADATPPAAADPSPPIQDAATEKAAPPPSMEDAAALTADSDFRPFLAAHVPDDVHRAALRKLWMSDPIITTHDGLTDYAEDYTFKPDIGEAVRTVWRAGSEALEQTAAAAPKDDGDGAADTRYVQQNITKAEAHVSDEKSIEAPGNSFADAQ